MASETSRPGASADSYIGSLISLTSKFEIRYEGVLYNINTEESSIGLVNVRSFGTEGRKKEGPQIPASDKIYEYILFRGSDIKDLQVKSSPPVQSAPIHNDPAIIQSHYSRPPPSSTSVPPVGSGTVAELSSNPAQGGLPKPPFQGNLPLYQPGGSLGSWASSPAPPTASGSGLAMPGQMPMYWQGYYAPAGTLPHMQQPPFVRLPPGLSIPQSLQQPLQYPVVTGSLTSGSQNMQEVPSSLMPTFSSTSSSTSATNPSTLAPFQVSSLPPESSSSHVQSKATLTSYPISVPAINLSFMPQFASSLESVNSFSQNVSASISSNPRLANHQSGPQSVATSSSNQLETSSTNLSFAPQLHSNSESVSLPHNMPASIGSNPRALSVPNDQTKPQSVPSAVDLTRTNQVETAASLVTPNQLLQPSLPVVSSSQPLQTSTKDVEVKPEEDKSKPLLPEPPMLAPADTKEPILPLPTPTHQQSNGAVLHTHQFARGRGRGPRGRGNGYPRPVARFTQDFDFDAMNEKFNKDEVWGHLGRNKSQSRDADEDDEEYYEDDEDGSEPTKSDKKPVYVKDDFFDTLSCNSLDRESRNGRTRFSEQLKIDTETFGEFSRHHPNRGGGRGYRGGGRARGSYYSRGFGGYGGRGGGRGGPHRPF